MSEGLPKPLHQCDNEQQEEEECDDAPNNDTVHFTRPIRAEDRKTRKQRRKEREIREAVCVIDLHIYNINHAAFHINRKN